MAGGPTTGSITVLFGAATGLRRPARLIGTAGLGTALTMADTDGNGRDELIATETPSNFGRILRYEVARGSFSLNRVGSEASRGTYGLAAGDLDGDGDDDVVSLYDQVGGTPSLAVFGGTPTGLSAEPVLDVTGGGGSMVAVGDLNRDGNADLVVGQPSA